MIRTDTVIIGGGAAGLTAAVAAARMGVRTAVVEHTGRIGKKILATGNGKCNYTNSVQGVSEYRGKNPAFVLPVFSRFGFSETVSFFEELGITPKVRDGWYYPASGQASSVLDVLKMELRRLRVAVYLEQQPSQIRQKPDGFIIQTETEMFYAKTLIAAPGLMASPKTGSDGSLLPLIRELGHSVEPVVPALVQLTGNRPFFKKLAGIRIQATVSLAVAGSVCIAETGELQLTEYGISGIPVFQLSRFATMALREKKEVIAYLNFLPEAGDGETDSLLRYRFVERAGDKTAAEALIGLFPEKLIHVLLKEAEISGKMPACSVSEQNRNKLKKFIHDLPVQITGSKGFDAAQVCAGGICTEEIHPETMESKCIPSLFFAGEVVDIDGRCGGYNLQWAWSSGYVAGVSAAAKVLAKTGEPYDKNQSVKSADSP